MKNISFFLDSTRAFELLAFAIVLCPPFDRTHLLAEDEVRSDDADYECDDGEDKVGEGVFLR
jgi:hypothetical protein